MYSLAASRLLARRLSTFRTRFAKSTLPSSGDRPQDFAMYLRTTTSTLRLTGFITLPKMNCLPSTIKSQGCSMTFKKSKHGTAHDIFYRKAGEREGSTGANARGEDWLATHNR